jgi:hypothetical protein
MHRDGYPQVDRLAPEAFRQSGISSRQSVRDVVLALREQRPFRH